MAFRASVLSLVLTGALAPVSEEGSEPGIDGRLSVHVERGGETERVVVAVKAGRVAVSHARELRGVLTRAQDSDADPQLRPSDANPNLRFVFA